MKVNILLISFIVALSGCHQKSTILSRRQIDSISYRISELSKDLSYKKNDFTGVYWYAPISDTSSMESAIKSRLILLVRADGDYQLLSIYCGPRFIYHDQIRCNINDTVFETKHIDSIDSRLWKRETNAGIFVERIAFDRTTSNGIVDAICRSSGRVKVAYMGTHSETAQTILTDKELRDLRSARDIQHLISILNDTSASGKTKGHLQ